MLWYSPGDTLRKEFTTSSPANGQSVSADSLPTVGLAKNGVLDVAVTVTVTLIETGRYLATCTIPSGYAAGDTVSLRGAATVATVAGRDTLFETRLIAVDLTATIASQLFVDGGTNKLKVNTDHSVNSDAILDESALQTIADGINESTLTANQIAEALTGISTVNFVGPYMTGSSHKLIRGSAYLRANAMAPYVRVAKALYNLSGATAEFRVKIDRETAVTIAATIISYDTDYYEVYADISSTDSASLAVGIGVDQFWVTLAGGAEVGIAHCYLEVIAGIGVA